MGITESKAAPPPTKKGVSTAVAWKKFAVCYKQYVLTIWMHHKSEFSLLEEDRQPLLVYAASLGSTMLVAKCQTLEEPFRDHAELIANFVEESFGNASEKDNESISSKDILLGADTVSTCRSLMDHINYVTKQTRRRKSCRDAILQVWKDYVKALVCMVEGLLLDVDQISPNSDSGRRAIHNFEKKAQRVGLVLAQQRKENSI